MNLIPPQTKTYRRCLMTTLSFMLAFVPVLQAQDTRTVNKPTFPTTCVWETPNKTTVISGGISRPSSETSYDTSIQTDLDSCATNHPGEAVELTNAYPDNAFLIKQLTIPVGVTLVIDGGVTLFASIDADNYQNPAYPTTYCGTQGPNRDGCVPIITVAANQTGTESSIGSGIMGYGVIDGRGSDPNLIVQGAPYGHSYYWNTIQDYTVHNTGGQQVSPILISAQQASNFVLYKITLKDAPYFTVEWFGPDSNAGGDIQTTGFTAWGVKVLAPYNVENTDGLDIENWAKDATIAYSYISNGDDDVAIDAAHTGYPTSNITLNYVYTFSGLGLSVGSETVGGVSDVLMENITQNGTIVDGAFGEPDLGTGFHIKSSPHVGGLVNWVTYQNACQQNEPNPIWITPFQWGSGTNYPDFTNIKISNVTIEPNTVSGQTNYFFVAGYNSSYVTGLVLDNLYSYVTPTFDKTDSGSSQSTPQDVTYTLATQQSYLPGLSALNGSDGITVTGNPSEAASPQSCYFPELNGELYLSGSGGINNAQSETITLTQSVDLHAVIQASAEEFPTPTQEVVFLEGTTEVCHSSIVTASTGNDVNCSFTPTTTGVHTYTAQYSGDEYGYQDSNYPKFSFGSVQVTVNE